MPGAGKTYSDAEARKILGKEGIKVNSPKPKTSLDGVQKQSIDGLVDFKKGSKCEIVVTAGTERGHAKGAKSHGTGHKFDIRPNPCVDAHVEKSCKSIGKRNDGTPLYQCGPGVFAKETKPLPHWDILYKGK